MKDAYELFEQAKSLIEKSDRDDKNVLLKELRRLYVSVNDKDFSTNTMCYFFFKKRDGAIKGLFEIVNKLTGEIYNKD